MRNTAAHRGILTSCQPTHLRRQGEQLEDFFARQRSRVQHNTRQRYERFTDKMVKLAHEREHFEVTSYGLKQPSSIGAGFYGVRVEDEDD